MCLLWPLCADPRQLEEEAPPPQPGLAVSPVSLPSDPGSCSLPMPPGSQGHVQKAPSEAGPAPGCPLGWQRMEPVGSVSRVEVVSPYVVCAPHQCPLSFAEPGKSHAPLHLLSSHAQKLWESHLTLFKCCSCMHAKSLQSCPILCDPWTVTLQASQSMGFSRQEY